MPLCRRKRVIQTEVTPALQAALKGDPDRKVFFLETTGEIFETYEYVLSPACTSPSDPLSREYAARMSFYRLKQFQCEVTGKSGLDYFQALASERQEARTLHTRFPEQLKAPVLRAVQWRTCLPLPIKTWYSYPVQRLLVDWTILSKQYMSVSRTVISKKRVRRQVVIPLYITDLPFARNHC